MYGGELQDAETGTYTPSALLYQLSINSEGLPEWMQVTLPQAPNSRFGANIGVVGPFVFQYSGRQTNMETSSEGSAGDLYALCTFAEKLQLPRWIDLSNLNNQPISRVHYASTVVGTSIWIHGGEPSGQSVGQRREMSSTYENELYLLATSPDALPTEVACPRGFRRRPPPFGPCVDIGEIGCTHAWALSSETLARTEIYIYIHMYMYVCMYACMDINALYSRTNTLIKMCTYTYALYLHTHTYTYLRFR
jgi:hypothetical protein